MDDYMFRYHVNECRQVTEATSYLEILNYSVRHHLFAVYLLAPSRVLRSASDAIAYILHQDSFYNTCEEHPLTSDEFENFLHRRVRLVRCLSCCEA
jgi:hypothetical protein